MNIARRLVRVCLGIVLSYASVAAAWAQAPTVTSTSAARQVVNRGQNLTLTVTATGTPAPALQWRRNGRAIAGATATSYTITSAVATRDTGWYQVVASNTISTATSTAVFVNVAINPAQVVPWGAPEDGLATVPAGLTNLLSLTAGGFHSLALRADGTVLGWGGNGFGQTTVPAGLTNVVALAAGESHSLALRSDRTVVAWGNNGFGQSTVPAAATNVVSVVTGEAHSVALRADGTVVAWGLNANGQATVPGGLVNVVALAAGFAHTAALRSDGTVAMWGSNASGQTSQPAGLNNVVALAAGDFHTVALRADGTVVAWGSSDNGRTTVPAGLNNVVAIAAGNAHSLALRADGSVVAWGFNGYGEATLPVGLNNVVGIAAGGFHSLALRNASGGNIPLSPITQHPGSTGVAAGQSASFSVVAIGAPTYQWQKGNTPIPDATGATYRIDSTIPSDAGEYSAVVTTGGVGFPTEPATLTVNLPNGFPLIVTQPANVSVTAGARASFSSAVIGTANVPLTYQRSKGGTAINGATAATFVIASTAAGDAGSYSVLVRNPLGYDISGAATLTVNTIPVILANPGRLINLSILTSISAADPLFTVGTFVGGTGTAGTKALLVRAAGPSLTQLGVTGELSDPKLDIFSGQTVIASNDNWGGGAALSTAFAQVGAFGFAPATSRDAAVFNAAMPIGSYTVQISGVGGASGTVIAELYDATPAAAFTVTTPRLVNVSVLKQINAGTLLTAGFVVGGSTPRTVLVRAVGPTLAGAPFNVGGAMADPRIELFDRNAAIVASNDNWGGGAALSSAFAAVGAFPLGGASRDAALLVRLDPGNYTAQVSGVGNTGGVALVEVYEVP